MTIPIRMTAKTSGLPFVKTVRHLTRTRASAARYRVICENLQKSNVPARPNGPRAGNLLLKRISYRVFVPNERIVARMNANNNRHDIHQ